MASSPRASIWRSSARIAIDFPDPVAPVIRRCSHSSERGTLTPASSIPTRSPGSAVRRSSRASRARRDQSEPPQVLSLRMIAGVMEDQIGDCANAPARRQDAPKAVEGVPLAEGAPLVEPPIQEGVHAPDGVAAVSIRQRKEVERSFCVKSQARNQRPKYS